VRWPTNTQCPFSDLPAAYATKRQLTAASIVAIFGRSVRSARVRVDAEDLYGG
jgi:hypothetical protein